MKLLFDHNLSPRLVNRLADVYPSSQHIFLLGLEQAEERVVWEYARQYEFVLVTRDSDSDRPHPSFFTQGKSSSWGFVPSGVGWLGCTAIILI